MGEVKDSEDLDTPSPTRQEAEEGKSLSDKQKELKEEGGQAAEPADQKHTDTTGTA